MKKYLTIAYLTLYFYVHVEAQNIVPNPSFEMLQTCDYYFDEFDKIKYWKAYSFTPDLFHACCKTEFLRTPYNVIDRQIPATGKGYAGVLTYHDKADKFKNEIIGVRLKTPVRKGQKYRVSFKISFAREYAQYASNNIGLLFTNMPENTLECQKAHLNCSEVVTESEAWYKVQGVLSVEEDYAFLVIGNFFTIPQTRLIRQESGNFQGAYYFIDDVAVFEAAMTEELTVKEQIRVEEMEEIVVKDKTSIAGKVLDAKSKKPIVAKVEFVLPNTSFREEYETDYLTGQYAFADIVSSATFVLKVSARNYYAIEQYVEVNDSKRISKDFYLEPLTPGNVIELRQVTFKSEQADIDPSSYSALSRLIQLLRANPTMRIEVSSFSGNREDMALAQARAKTLIDYLGMVGKINRNRLSSETYYQTEAAKYIGGAADANKLVDRIAIKILN